MPIAIITPAMNAERFIARTLESVLAQTYGDWQHIVVDDGSTDSTAEIVRSFAERDPRFQLISQPNSGVSAARNAGYKASPDRCQYVIFLDADDLLSPKSLELLRAALEANPNVPAAHGRSACIDADDAMIPHVTRERLGRRMLKNSGALLSSSADVIVLPDSSPTSFAALAFTNPISTPGQVLLRRSAVDRVGLFDSRANLAEDWDLYLRVAQTGPFAYVPDVLLLYRQHASNASAQFGKMRRAELYVRHKVIASSATVAEARTAARAGMRYFELQRCAERLKRAANELQTLRLWPAAKELLRASSSLFEGGRTLLPWPEAYGQNGTERKISLE